MPWFSYRFSFLDCRTPACICTAKWTCGCVRSCLSQQLLVVKWHVPGRSRGHVEILASLIDGSAMTFVLPSSIVALVTRYRSSWAAGRYKE